MRAKRLAAERFDRRRLVEEFEAVLTAARCSSPGASGGRSTGAGLQEVRVAKRVNGLDISYSIGDLRPDEWRTAARLIAEAVPNAVISYLGDAFGGRFYGAVARQPYACAFGAHHADGNLLGVILGTLDHPRSYAEAIASQRPRLALAANVRILSPAVVRWGLRGLRERGRRAAGAEDRPAAELLVISVRPEARGTGLAQRLVDAMEAFMRRRGYAGDYVIRTEGTNDRANRFYEKIGAQLVHRNRFHGRLINEWHKPLAVGETMA